MKLITRKEWGARKASAPAPHLPSTRGVKIHYMGSRVDPRLADDHNLCAPAVRRVQVGHMDGNGWNDIGYSFVVCPHAYVFEGRGLHRLPAANGSGLNSGHYAVLGLVGNAGLVDPTDAMLNGIRDAIDYLRADGAAGKEIKGHKDGYATSCPGPKLYAWIKDGAPRPAAPKPPPTSQRKTEDIVKDLPTLKPGATGPFVERAQALLVANGDRDLKIDGVSGTKTQMSVRDFKVDHGLDANAIVGLDTWAALLGVG